LPKSLAVLRAAFGAGAAPAQARGSCDDDARFLTQERLPDMRTTRREFSRLALGALAMPRTLGAAIDSTVGGVRLGVQTYSFRELPRPEGGQMLDVIVNAMTECGLGDCELFAPQLEPRMAFGRGRPAPGSPEAEKAREEQRRFRLETPLAHFQQVKQKFDAAGITIFAYNYSFNRSFSDEEIDRGFEIARALGAGVITASTTLSVAKRVAPFAEKHKLVVAMHNHSNLKDPDEFATPESFAAAMKMSSYFKINLDIGHFTAADFDALAFIREQHAHITNLHLKDRKRNQGDNLPWGEGDTPIREALQLLKRERWPIRAHVEYEYKGAGPIEEVKRCYAYAKRALA
jgi:sugar phosphate isomerase/epimerase